MKANRKFIDDVKRKLTNMRNDEQYSYMRGLLAVRGNSATTLELERMMEAISKERLVN